MKRHVIRGNNVFRLDDNNGELRARLICVLPNLVKYDHDNVALDEACNNAESEYIQWQYMMLREKLASKLQTTVDWVNKVIRDLSAA